MDSRIEVLHGSPSAEELAAAVVALTPVAGSTDPAATGAPAGTTAGVPAWSRAALLEGVGGPQASTPADLVRHPS